MDHNDVRHRLSEYLDNAITDEERASIEAHLQACDLCSNALKELQKTIEFVRTVPDIEPPAWMTQKIMANVREVSEENGFFRKLRSLFSFTVPVRAVAVLFLSVTAFVIYRMQTMQTEYKPANAPIRESEVGKTTTQPASPMDKLARAVRPAIRKKGLRQAPGYKSLDMKLEYEKPAALEPEKRSLPAPSTSKSTAPLTSARVMAETKGEGASRNEATAPLPSEAIGSAAGTVAQSPRAGIAALSDEQTAPPVAEAPSRRQAFDAAAREKAVIQAEADKTQENIEHVTVEQYPSGRPKLIERYTTVGSQRIRIAEERFNADGKRDGIQKQYFESGRLKVEAKYSNGKLAAYQEYLANGVKKTGKSDFDWIWLKE